MFKETKDVIRRNMPPIDEPLSHPKILRYSKDTALFIGSCAECPCRYNLVCQLSERVLLFKGLRLQNLNKIHPECLLDDWPEDDL